ncbi:hypothetical protein B7494_g3748 [Chlorociboria aeruginascens]|nr:hypothetical protein B7494_g3748 [Chlorociboria aeruginascens]
MSVYDDEPRRHRSHHHRRDDREPRYVETQETYVRGPAAPAVGDAYVSRQTDLIRRPTREDSDLSIEEVRRDFPPPGSDYYDRYGPPARSRSADRYGRYDDTRSDYGDRKGRKTLAVEEKVVEHRRRSLSRNQKIMAAVGGAALAVGGKELWDRKQAHGQPVSRNVFSTAAMGAAGAFAAYEGAELYVKHGNKAQEKVKRYMAHQGKDGKVAEYYSSDEESVKPKKSRRKSLVEGALGLAGLGAAAKAASGGSHDKEKESRSGRSRSRRGSVDSYRSHRSRRSSKSRDKSPEGIKKFQQAAKAALLAGATEAFRLRKERGPWTGTKGRRVITAAVGAGGIDAAADRDPDKKSKRHILEAVVAGLAGNRLINGSSKTVEEADERHRSRSRARSRSRSTGGGGAGATGLAALATAGLGALAGKKLLDRSRSRSRADDRRRRYSSDSYDSRSPSPARGKNRRKRSKSVTDYARKGIAALGLGGAAGHDSDRRRGDVEEVEETHIRKSRRGGSDDDHRHSRRRDSRDSYDDRSRGDPYGDSRYADSHSSNVGSTRGSARKKDGQKNRRVAEGKQSESDTDSLGSSSGDEKRIKKMKGKQFLTAGLATVATIHAAHNIYQSMEKRDARHKAVAEGEMTQEEARKLKAKAVLQDAASVGIAALGIKGAISEIKEANAMRGECKKLRTEKEERHQKRLQRLNSSKGNSSNGSGGGRRKENGYNPSQIDYRREPGPHYYDDNPYNSAQLPPPPPVGYDRS